MASSSTAALPGPNITALKEEVYEQCLDFCNDEEKNKNGFKAVFHQNTIIDMDIIPKGDVHIMLQVSQALLDEKLFIPMQDGEGLGWRVRTREDAKKYRGLTAEQAMVYGLIDEAGADGMWTKMIKTRLKLHDSLMKACLKHLESKNMIADMKSVQHPTRRMLIKASLRPSELASGGPWFTDGELDEEFIRTVMEILLNQIQKRSFYRSLSAMRAPKKIISKKMTPAQAKAARDEALGNANVEDERAKKKRIFEASFPMPVEYRGYPTAEELTVFVEQGGYFKETVLGNKDIKTVLELMCYDGTIEEIAVDDGVGYKAARQSLRDQDERGSVLNEAPCGRCPVFEICEEGGPVEPRTCKYFEEWLKPFELNL